MSRISHFHDTNMLIIELLNNRHRYCDKPIRKVTVSASLARVRGDSPSWNTNESLLDSYWIKIINSHNLYHWCVLHDELIISQCLSYDDNMPIWVESIHPTHTFTEHVHQKNSKESELTLFLSLTSAPLSINTFTRSNLPLLHAHINRTKPSYTDLY